MAERNYTIDIFRIVGAFCVVALHSPLDELPNSAALLIRLLSRWAVPFFFLVSGYFIAKNSTKSGSEVFLKSINNLIGIYIISNIFYFIYYLVDSNPSTVAELTFVKFLHGQCAHLWFIAASIFGLLLLQFCSSRYSDRILLIIASLAFGVVLAITGYSSVLGLSIQQETAHYLSAIPFIFSGFLIARHETFVQRISVISCIGLLIVGVALEGGEAIWLYRQFGMGPHNQELLVGTAVIALSLFCFSLNYVITTDNVLSQAGRRYSLIIYLYHPLIISLIYSKSHQLSFPGLLNIMSPVIVFAATLSLMILLYRFIPKAFNTLNGG